MKKQNKMENKKFKGNKSLKRNSIILLLCLSLPLFLLISCNSEENEIKTTAIDYLKAALACDFSEAKKHVTKERVASYENYEEDEDFLLLSKSKLSIDLLQHIISDQSSNYKIVNLEIADDKLSAKAIIKITARNHSSFNDRTISLIKEDGDWKVNEDIEDIVPNGIVHYTLETGFIIIE